MTEVKKILARKLPIYLVLIDPEKCATEKEIKRTAQILSEIDVDGVLIGGSANLTADSIIKVFSGLREKVEAKPLVSFVRDASEITALADACFASMIMNSRKPWFLFDNFLNCIDTAYEVGVEVITLGYLVAPGETSVSFVMDPHPIFGKEAILRKYARFIDALRFDFAYLEGGSGARETISPDIVAKFKKFLKTPLLVGGGIKSSQEAKALLAAGADGLVTGTMLEAKNIDVIKDIISLVKEYRNEDS